MIVYDLTLLDLPRTDADPGSDTPAPVPTGGAHALRTGRTTRAARALHLLRLPLAGARRRPAAAARPALTGRRRLVAATAAVVALTLGPAGTALACLPFVPPVPHAVPHAAPSCGKGCAAAGHPTCRPGSWGCGQPGCGHGYGCPGTPPRAATPRTPRNHPPVGVTPPVGIVPPGDTPPADTPPADAPPTGTGRPPAATPPAPPAPPAQPHPSKPAPRCGDGTPAGKRGCETVTAPPSFTG